MKSNNTDLIERLKYSDLQGKGGLVFLSMGKSRDVP